MRPQFLRLLLQLAVLLVELRGDLGAILLGLSVLEIPLLRGDVGTLRAATSAWRLASSVLVSL